MNEYIQNNSLLPSPQSAPATDTTSVFRSMRILCMASTWVLSFQEMHLYSRNEYNHGLEQKQGNHGQDYCNNLLERW